MSVPRPRPPHNPSRRRNRRCCRAGLWAGCRPAVSSRRRCGRRRTCRARCGSGHRRPRRDWRRAVFPQPPDRPDGEARRRCRDISADGLRAEQARRCACAGWRCHRPCRRRQRSVRQARRARSPRRCASRSGPRCRPASTSAASNPSPSGRGVTLWPARSSARKCGRKPCTRWSSASKPSGRRKPGSAPRNSTRSPFRGRGERLGLEGMEQCLQRLSGHSSISCRKTKTGLKRKRARHKPRPFQL